MSSDYQVYDHGDGFRSLVMFVLLSFRSFSVHYVMKKYKMKKKIEVRHFRNKVLLIKLKKREKKVKHYVFKEINLRK